MWLPFLWERFQFKNCDKAQLQFMHKYNEGLLELMQKYYHIWREKLEVLYTSVAYTPNFMVYSWNSTSRRASCSRLSLTSLSWLTLSHTWLRSSSWLATLCSTPGVDFMAATIPCLLSSSCWNACSNREQQYMMRDVMSTFWGEGDHATVTLSTCMGLTLCMALVGEVGSHPACAPKQGTLSRLLHHGQERNWWSHRSKLTLSVITGIKPMTYFFFHTKQLIAKKVTQMIT